jgi:hypothetical protein
MKTITQYQTDDGELHDSPKTALSHAEDVTGLRMEDLLQHLVVYSPKDRAQWAYSMRKNGDILEDRCAELLKALREQNAIRKYIEENA